MLGQSWKRVATYERELGRQGKSIPIPRHPRRHRHRIAKPAYLSQTDKDTIMRWALVCGPLALLLGVITGMVSNQTGFMVATPPALTLPLPTFGTTTNSPSDTTPCVRRVSLLRQDMDPTIPSSSNTVETTPVTPSSSEMETSNPPTSSSTKSQD